MIRVPVVTSDASIIQIVQEAAAALSDELQPVFLSGKDAVVEYLKYELPEIKILDCSGEKKEASESLDILDAIRSDPWLHYGGVVAIHSGNDDQAFQERLRDSNVIAVLHKRELQHNIERLLRILTRNKQFLFQRGMQQHLMRKISGTFIMDNDPLDIVVYSNLVTNYLYNANLVNKEDKEKLHVAFLELLVNAIEHGNCKISFDEKTAWLEDGRDAMDLIREKNKDPEISMRKVSFSYAISPDSSAFGIEDEGDGFDWRARMAAKPELGLHGMGMRMAGIYVRDLAYNEKGNAVSFRIIHQKDSANVVPVIFTAQEEVVFKDREIVVREGETSDYLYYIVSGRFLVFAGNKYVSYLTPDDMFIGEMSFLLSNQRSATVVAKGEGRVVKISKQDFVNLIKQNPHYGIFLARLLAQRLTRLNSRAARLNAECLRLKNIVEKKGCADDAIVAEKTIETEKFL
ncbi:MAG: cyclic nucleotide-binding domain-containing protein [Treponemataceae bacterium]